AGGDVVTYARALAGLESQRPRRFSLAPAANGGTLVNRVRRLIDPAQAASDNLPGPGSAWAMSLLWVAGIGIAMAHAAQVNNDRIMYFWAAPEAILYDPFLPTPQALNRRYGIAHEVLPNGTKLLRSTPGTLDSKYARLHNVLRGGTERFRQDATYAPLPQYPQSSLRAGNHGLVVIEVVVSPAGRVSESLILASFDRDASAAVTAALNAWRFHSVEELSRIFDNWKACDDCIRIARFGFEFQLAGGTGSVVDLAAAEVRRRGLPSPFLKQAR
ncbi:MAG: TonB family protein, partial [Acidobacteria bacterium]|nr:TonB family protein [Acidobacteriota bacterium]